MLWIEEPKNLYDVTRLRYFFPSAHMSWEEQANASFRFVIYLSFLLFIYNNNYTMLIMPIVFIGLLQYYLYNEGRLPAVMKSLFGGQGEIKEGFIKRHPDVELPFEEESPNKLFPVQGLEDNPTKTQARAWAKLAAVPDPTEPQAKRIFKEQQAHRFAQSVKRDMAKRFGVPKDACGNPLGGYPGEPGFTEQPIVCKKSSEANPFNNAMPYDPIDRQIYPSCPDEQAKDDNFHKNLFNDIDDVFNKANGQLIFNSKASTTRINDREAFMQFLFNTPYVEYPEGA